MTVAAVETPVVVIGAGPVGQTTALLLARWGVPVVLLEARASRELAGSRSICQQRDVLDVWAHVGAEAIAEEGVTWTTARTYYRDRELFAWSFADRGRSPLPPFVNISQSRTEELLDRRIAAEPLISVRWNREVTALEQDASTVTARCADGSAFIGTHAVLCAGARAGGLREALGVGFPGESFADRFLICDLRASLPGWETERRFYFDPVWNPGRQVLIHPCPDSSYRIDWQVPPDFDLAAEEASGGLDRRIRQVLGARPYELIWHSVYRFHSRLADRMAVGRVLLAGDAAHLVAPFGARGLNSGVPDAENAAWKIAFARLGWGAPGLPDTYHAERHPAALENLEVTAATMRFLAPQTDAERTHRREVLEKSAADPALAPAVDSGRFAEPYWYVDSPLTTPDPSRVFAGRPPKGQAATPGPGLIVPDAPVTVPGRPEVTRLRQVLRGGLTVLVPAPGDVAGVRTVLRGLGPVPSAAYVLSDLDPDGLLTEALEARPGEAWLIRPDAHVAAVLPANDPEALRAAAHRALGLT
ncbi:MAG: pentachlorophenol monooxygenase [Streptosporangiales bacterium]|nr:pentachlorophenol monooxygenase [Streptosporangiales bacterium]